MWCVCGQLRGVTLERNKQDYYTPDYHVDGDGTEDYHVDGGKIVADGVEWKE